jgi:hypothetical protein
MIEQFKSLHWNEFSLLDTKVALLSIFIALTAVTYSSYSNQLLSEEKISE